MKGVFMPVYRNEKEYFWGQIENNTEYNKFPEMYKLLNDRTCDEEFYHLCKNFIDIALNAPKFPNKENLTVEACFQYSDMDKAKRATQDFISKFNIQNIEELLTVIKMFYPYASNDNRAKSGTLFKDSPYGSPNIGIYIDFCRIPDEIWNKLVEDILNNNL